MTKPPTPSQIERLKSLGAATVYEAQGARGALDGGIKPIDPTLRLVGTAFTIDCRPGDNLMIHYALTLAGPGDVLVVDAKGFTEVGHMGDIVALAAQKLKVAGMVIDGAVRDADAMITMGFPVFCRGLSIKSPHKTGTGRVNAPISCGGVVVNPGDIIVGDRDGVVVVAAGEVGAVIESAVKREEKEDRVRQGLEQGKTTVELFDLGPKLEKMGHPIVPRKT